MEELKQFLPATKREVMVSVWVCGLHIEYPRLVVEYSHYKPHIPTWSRSSQYIFMENLAIDLQRVPLLPDILDKSHRRPPIPCGCWLFFLHA